MQYLLYEDKPQTDIWMRLVLGVPPLALVAGVPFAIREDMNAGLLLLGEAVFLTIVFICIIPTTYRIFNDSIQIAFRVPWTLNIPFITIETLKPPRWYTAGINLPTCFSSSRSLQIIRIKRMTVTISPSNQQAFIDQFQKAYTEWQRSDKVDK